MKLIDSGIPNFGISKKPFDEINYLDYDYRCPMGDKLSDFRKRLAYNHFQYLGVISNNLIFGCAQVKTKLGLIIFCYVFNTKTKQLKKWNFKDVGSIFSQTVNTPTYGTSTFRRGNRMIQFINNNSPMEKRLIIDIPGELNVDVYFSETEPHFNPMCITTQAGINGWVYAQKVAGVKCLGTIECDFGKFTMEDLNAYAHHDWSGGYMRRETFWSWACLSGEISGKRVGLNLSCGVNETSFTENCYWINGELIKVDTVRFQFDRDNPSGDWLITSFDGQIDLKFTPEGYYQEKQNLILVASNFKQYFGLFSGRIGGLNIKNQYGFVEDQYAKW